MLVMSFISFFLAFLKFLFGFQNIIFPSKYVRLFAGVTGLFFQNYFTINW